MLTKYTNFVLFSVTTISKVSTWYPKYQMESQIIRLKMLNVKSRLCNFTLKLWIFKTWFFNFSRFLYILVLYTMEIITTGVLRKNISFWIVRLIVKTYNKTFDFNKNYNLIFLKNDQMGSKILNVKSSFHFLH